MFLQKIHYPTAGSYLYVFFLGTDHSVKAEKVQSAKAYQGVDDPGNPAHASKNQGYKVKIEESNQTPVDRSDYGKSKAKTS